MFLLRISTVTEIWNEACSDLWESGRGIRIISGLGKGRCRLKSDIEIIIRKGRQTHKTRIIGIVFPPKSFALKRWKACGGLGSFIETSLNPSAVLWLLESPAMVFSLMWMARPPVVSFWAATYPFRISFDSSVVQRLGLAELCDLRERQMM
jgi:hypothetical protein